MKAEEVLFLDFLEGKRKNFIIPVYQRNYDWKKEHCKQLFDDLKDVANMDRTHFLGSIVSISDEHSKEFWIIDGQQRLTTISLLLLAIEKVISKGLLEYSRVEKGEIKEDYLVNKRSKEEKIKLKPVKNDRDAFNALFQEDENSYIQDSNVTVNFQYFYNRILKKEISIDRLYSAIEKLIIVEINLSNQKDDPQLIFESLNSTGLNLTEADKVRNFILMKEETSIQERFYIEYWHKLEINTNYRVSDFIRDYLTIKERNIPNKNKVYIHFKNYIIKYKHDTNIENLLKDLLKFSLYYKKIINARNMKDELSLILNKINRLESVVSYPFIMELLEDKEKNIINEKEVLSILNIIVSFVFRRLICDVPTNALNKIFMTMGRDIKKHNNYQECYVEVFKYILVKKKTYQRFPSDEEFKLKLLQKDIYNLKNKNRLFLLEQLENFNNKEIVFIEDRVSSKELNIEHIMPQKLTASWRKDLGNDFLKIHKQYLHTLGNITLTGYNSQMSNKLFIEKRDMENGFKDSRLFLNKGLSNLKKWNKSTILDRGKELQERALKIWIYPNTTYESEEDRLKVCTLSDDGNFTGEKILSYSFMGDSEQAVSSWKNFYKQISSILYELDPVKYKQIITDNKFIYDGKNSYKVGDFHIYVNMGAEGILARLRTVIEEIGLDLDELSFNIK
jgi:uncharacterized protein with ParB-like and HNH nuclease domain